MGSSSSKDKDISEGNLRTRPNRQSDFEEEIIEDDIPFHDRIATSRPIRRSNSIHSNSAEDDYFSKFHKKQTSATTSRFGGQSGVASEPTVKDPEVEAAIAELEETFKALDGTSSPEEEGQLRSQSCGPLSGSNNEPIECDEFSKQQQQQQQRKFVPNKGCSRGEASQNGHSKAQSGRRQRPGHEGQPHLYSRRLHPSGLTHLSRGQSGTQPEGGASSAPPGVSTFRERSDSEDWNYELPKIEGFDIEKFKAVNGPKNPPPISIRLPSEEEEEDFIGSRSKGPSYTKDEMELFNKLEREVY